MCVCVYIGPLRINASDMMQSYEDNLLKDKPKGLEPLVVCVLCVFVLFACVCACACVDRVRDSVCASVRTYIYVYVCMYVCMYM